MKKVIYLIAIIVCFISCNQKRNSLVTEVTTDSSTSIEKFLVSYHKSHPDWLINEAVARRTNDSLMTIFESMADTIFNGYPFEAVCVNEYEKGGFCVNLRAWQRPRGFELKDEIHEIGGDILALVSEEQALKVKEKDFYTFKGHFVKRTNHDFFVQMTRRSMHYTNDYGVDQDDILKDKYNFGFGILVYMVDTLAHY